MNFQFSDDGPNDVAQQGRRTAYSAPKLVEYGALRDITLTTNPGRSNRDGGSPASSNKTNGT